MQQEPIADILSDRTELSPPIAVDGEDQHREPEPHSLQFVVPPPPVPGMTCWSIAPL